MKRPILFSRNFIRTGSALLMFATYAVSAQSSVYDNFEGQKMVHYHQKGGVLDTAIKNPSADKVNPSATCALYVRNGSRKFDNIKMALSSSLTSVDKYATYLGVPPRFHLKVYTTAPAGTLVEILLGSRKGNNDYPAGTHSQYQAYTKKSNEWEELEFLFSQIPQGSETAAEQIDQVVLLFNPNSNTSDTWYFDDLTGPALAGAAGTSTGTSTGAVETSKPEINPAATKTVNPANKSAKSTQQNKKSKNKG